MRLAAKFAVNRPIVRPEQNFMLLPNQANVMSPILMISPERQMDLTSLPDQTGPYADTGHPGTENDRSRPRLRA